MHSAHLVLPIVAAMIGVAASDAPVETQVQLTDRACSELRSAEARMNGVFQQLLAHPQNDGITIRRLQAAQAAWESFRKAELGATFPHDDDPTYYGSAFGMCYCDAATTIVEARTSQLERLLRTPEGQLCGEPRR
jgi:uncharacterized protein YecT (DUF1311 family)